MTDTAPAEPKEVKVTVGSTAIAALRAGMDNNAALEAVKAVFPDAKTSLASINWYRNKLRSEGEEIATAREIRTAAIAAAAAEAGGGDDKTEDAGDDFAE
jgi:hypothetical protein